MAIARRLYDFARLNHVIFPGVDRPRCADFLRDYYEYYAHGRGRAFRTKNAAFYVAFRRYVPARARAIAGRWNKDDAWIEQATEWGRRHFWDPRDIATFGIEDEGAFCTYQRRFEQVFVVRALETGETDHAADLIDKARFAQRCETLGLATPRTIALVSNGAIAWRAGVGRAIDIIAKPVRGSGGAGIVTGVVRQQDDLADMLARLPRADWIVQERLRPHDNLIDIALDALPTARIVTLLDEAGRPEIVAQAIRFAAIHNVPVDNAHQGGLAAAIDLASGVLRKPQAMDGPASCERHPATGAQITGRTVPDWQTACDLALRAHSEGYANHVVIGWDIGFAQTGPVLIEGNQRPNVRLTQRTTGQGIGATRYGALVQHHLRRRIDAGEPPGGRFLVRP